MTIRLLEKLVSEYIAPKIGEWKQYWNEKKKDREKYNLYRKEIKGEWELNNDYLDQLAKEAKESGYSEGTIRAILNFKETGKRIKENLKNPEIYHIG